MWLMRKIIILITLATVSLLSCKSQEEKEAEKAEKWASRAGAYRKRANDLLWDGGKFQHHVHLDEIDHGDFDERNQLAMGNTWAVTRGLADGDQARAAFLHHPAFRLRLAARPQPGMAGAERGVSGKGQLARGVEDAHAVVSPGGAALRAGR